MRKERRKFQISHQCVNRKEPVSDALDKNYITSNSSKAVESGGILERAERAIFASNPYGDLLLVISAG